MFKEIFAINRFYKHFESLRDEALDWDLDFRQIGPGEQGHKLLQLVDSDFQFIYTVFNTPYDQRSATPRHLRSFSILADHRAPATWCGQNFGWNSFVCFPVGDEFRALSMGYFSNYIFSLPEDLLAKTANDLFHADWEQLDREIGRGVIQFTDRDMNELRSLLRGFTIAAGSSEVEIAHQPFVAELAERIIQGLLNAVSESVPRGTLNRRKYFLAAQNYIDTHLETPLLISDVCQALDVSVRSLEYAFLQQGGLKPKTYLNCQRLSQVHRSLMESPGGDTTVNEIANRWGFWHMGQFARDYRKIYGVNPSETLANAWDFKPSRTH
jgi:AraC family transcriptional regulator, ethanolamine operon transcriptional activator